MPAIAQFRGKNMNYHHTQTVTDVLDTCPIVCADQRMLQVTRLAIAAATSVGGAGSCCGDYR